jgi:hypothetical protein
MTSLLGGALETGKRRFARSFAFRNPRARSFLARDALGTSETLHVPGCAASLPRASPAAMSSLPGMRMALCDFQKRFLRPRAPSWRKKAPSQFIGRSHRIQSEAIGSSARLSNPARGYRIQREAIESSARPSDPERGYRIQREAIEIQREAIESSARLSKSSARLSNPERGYRTWSDITIFSACFCFKATRSLKAPAASR